VNQETVGFFTDVQQLDAEEDLGEEEREIEGESRAEAAVTMASFLEVAATNSPIPSSDGQPGEKGDLELLCAEQETVASQEVEMSTIDSSIPRSLDQRKPVSGDKESSLDVMSTGGKHSKDEDHADDSDTLDNEQERIQENEKVQPEVTAIGGEFCDTTEDENDEDVDRVNNTIAGNTNRTAETIRKADVLRASSGYGKY
jgi:hypothetical protein